MQEQPTLKTILPLSPKLPNGVQFVGDDHGDTTLNATLLDVQGDVNLSGWGIISSRTDNDVFFVCNRGRIRRHQC